VKAGTIVSILVVITLLGATVCAFSGVEPFSNAKDKVVGYIPASVEDKVMEYFHPIATVESVGWQPFLGCVKFSLVAENALPGKTYDAEFYVRGELRESRPIRFSKQNVDAGVAKLIQFKILNSDLNLNDASSLLSNFSLKIKEAPANWRDLPEVPVVGVD